MTSSVNDDSAGGMRRAASDASMMSAANSLISKGSDGDMDQKWYWMWGDTNMTARRNPIQWNLGYPDDIVLKLQKASQGRPVLVRPAEEDYWKYCENAAGAMEYMDNWDLRDETEVEAEFGDLTDDLLCYFPEAPYGDFFTTEDALCKNANKATQRVDDTALALGFASWIPLNDEGYSELHIWQSNYAMKCFLERLLEEVMGKEVVDKKPFQELIWDVSGCEGKMPFVQLMASLKNATWAQEIPEEEEDVTASESIPPLSVPEISVSTVDFASPKAVPNSGTTQSMNLIPIVEDSQPSILSTPSAEIRKKTGTVKKTWSAISKIVAFGALSKKDGATDAVVEKPSARAGKGKGKGGRTGPASRPPAKVEPSRPENALWAEKKVHRLRWRRILSQAADDTGWFSTAANQQQIEELIDDEALASLFEGGRAFGATSSRASGMTAAASSASAATASVGMSNKISSVGLKTRELKKVIWESTTKQTAQSRRQNMSIMMKGWPKGLREEFLDNLGNFNMTELKESGVLEHRLKQLCQAVEQMDETKEEWKKMSALSEDELKALYEWDHAVEGFFRRLHGIKDFRQRLMFLNEAISVEDELFTLSADCDRLTAGINVVFEKEDLVIRFLQAVLLIGNRFNAGAAQLNRADAYDVVELLESTTFLEAYRGAQQMTLLEYIKERVLSEEDRIAFRMLGQELASFESEYSKDNGKENNASANVVMMRRTLGHISRQLGTMLKGVERGINMRKADMDPNDAVTQAELVKLNALKDPVTSVIGDTHNLERVLDELEVQAVTLQTSLCYNNPKDRHLDMGRILGVIGRLSSKLGLVTKSRPRDV